MQHPFPDNFFTLKGACMGQNRDTDMECKLIALACYTIR
jgi:hypothetical protein